MQDSRRWEGNAVESLRLVLEGIKDRGWLVGEGGEGWKGKNGRECEWIRMRMLCLERMYVDILVDFLIPKGYHSKHSQTLHMRVRTMTPKVLQHALVMPHPPGWLPGQCASMHPKPTTLGVNGPYRVPRMSGLFRDKALLLMLQDFWCHRPCSHISVK